MESASFQSDARASPPSVTDRLGYIRARMGGVTPEAILTQALEERAERLTSRVQNLFGALSENRERIERSITDLVKEVESFERFDPADREIASLRQTLTDATEKHSSLISLISEGRQSLDRKIRERNMLADKITELNLLARQRQDSDTAKFLDQLGIKVPYAIYQTLNRS